MSALQAVTSTPQTGSPPELLSQDAYLQNLDAPARVRWALQQFGEHIVLASSFGAQSAVSLHMVTRERPDIPVILVDTGYLFAETYRFVDELTERLRLNLQVYRPGLSPAWQEARYGKLWEQGREGIERYNRMNKVEPMERALEELGAQAWISGIRRSQATTRRNFGVLAGQQGRIKVHPLIDWTDYDVYQYLSRHDLPYHPLWHEGYLSIGDWHTSHPVSADMDPEQGRFFGLVRECGLHQSD